MTPPWIFVCEIFDGNKLDNIENEDALFKDKIISYVKSLFLVIYKKTIIIYNRSYHTNSWCCEQPTYLPPITRVVTDHISYAIVKSINSESPRYGDALEKYQKQKTKSTHRVGIQKLKHIHPTLSINIDKQIKFMLVQSDIDVSYVAFSIFYSSFFFYHYFVGFYFLFFF